MSSWAELRVFIDAEKTSYGVRRLCRLLGVSKTAYYDHRGRDGGASISDWSDAHHAHTAGRPGPSTAASTCSPAHCVATPSRAPV